MIKIVPVSVSQPGVKGGGKYRYCGSIQLLALGIKSCQITTCALFPRILGLAMTKLLQDVATSSLELGYPMSQPCFVNFKPVFGG